MIYSKKLSKNLVLLIFTICAVLLFVAGVFAYRKEMSLQVSIPVHPGVYCEIQMKKPTDFNYSTIFSNVSGSEHVAGNLSFTANNAFTISDDFGGGLASSFMLKFINYTDSKIIVEATGVGAMANAVACDAFVVGSPKECELEVVTVTGDVVFNFTPVENVYTVTKNLTNCHLDSYNIATDELDYNATILETQGLNNSIVVNINAVDYTIENGVANNGITYNKTNGKIFIPKAMITGNIVFTIVKSYVVNFMDNDGVTIIDTKYYTANATYGTMPTYTKAGYSTLTWHGKNFLNEAELVVPGNYTKSGYWKYNINLKSGIQYAMSAGYNIIYQNETNPHFYALITNYYNYDGSGLPTNFYNYWIGHHSKLYACLSTNSYTTFTTSTVTNATTYYMAVAIGDNIGDVNDVIYLPNVLNHIQVEYGPQKTAFEAYRGYVTASSTILNQDHNVYAVWS